MPYPARMFNCARCACQVVICSHCDRGQIYCALDCAHAARKESLCQSGQRYQASRHGQLKHAARQARYRERQQQKVTHQGSDPGPRHDSLVQQLKLLLREVVPNTIRPETTTTARLICHFCHQPCLPFLRWVFLSQFSSSMN
jgi:hypothetical protein